MFDKIFAHVSPAHLREMNQIVVLSVSAAVTDSLSSHVAERLAWLEVALSSIEYSVGMCTSLVCAFVADTWMQNPELSEHIPGVMNTITDRLQDTYMSIAEESPSAPTLPMISRLVRRAKEVRNKVA